jgi:hypothetical protein
MCDPDDDENQEAIILDQIDDPVVSHADARQALLAL